MNYPVPKIPKDVVDVIEKYQFIAFKQNSGESSIMYWILDDIQECEIDIATSLWIENHLVDVAIAVQTNRYKTVKC